jgi:D-3-phosphoglycerate dehydrogenase
VELIELANDLQIIGRAGTGLDNIDLAAATRAGVVVASTPHHNAVSVAELTIGLVLALARNITAADRDTKAGGWNRKKYTGIELCGKTLGVVGFGRIGFLTAMHAHALGMRVVVFDPYVDPDSTLLSQARAELMELKDLLGQSNVVCCHMPSTAETHHMFNAQRFSEMKPGALFINVARGEVVDESALITALTEEHLAGAALDVRASEPATPGPLNQMDQVILTPHIGAFTVEAQHRVEAAVCRDVMAVLNGSPAINAVNFPSPRR